MENIADFISSLIPFLLAIAFFFLYARSGKFSRKNKQKEPEKQQEEEPVVQRILHTQKDHLSDRSFKPFPRQPKPVVHPLPPTRVQAQKKRFEEVSPSRVHPLQRLERYPIGKRAIVLSEIMGKPKAFDHDDLW